MPIEDVVKVSLEANGAFRASPRRVPTPTEASTNQLSVIA